ncbi:MAG: SDR family oxidoreductase [Bacteroidota bacterium]
MDLRLKNKVYVVSGGAKGIGEAICRTLVEEGAIPVILGRSEKEAFKLHEEFMAAGNMSYYIIKELASSDNCHEAIDEVVGRFGRIDGIINNAGVNDGAGLEKGVEAFESSVRTNLFHYYYLVHYALAELKRNKGSIINISSKTALTGQGGTSGYAASKGAQLALTREWAVELAPFGVRVNAIVPAEVMTPLYSTWLKTFEDPEVKLQSITSKIPLGKRMTLSEEIAATAVFLLSDRSGHTTGQWITVDGGYVHLDRAIT